MFSKLKVRCLFIKCLIIMDINKKQVKIPKQSQCFSDQKLSRRLSQANAVGVDSLEKDSVESL